MTTVIFFALLVAADAGSAPPAARPGQPHARPIAPPPVISPELAPDRRVTFRLKAPGAREVVVQGQWKDGKKAMSKGADGVWSVTVGPVEPGVWEYGFNVDGLMMLDPGNPDLKPQRSPRTSILDVPGPEPLVTQWREVPHGTVHVHQYRSKTTGTVRRLHVYTPPGYETAGGTRYPTMYLLHGRGDNDAAWSVHGRANLILDNLIAEGKARAMVVVMTDGHAVPEQGGKEILAQFKNNTGAYRRDLLTDVLPLVEARYRVRKDAASRAIVGLSMGGNQALTVGLLDADRFAWVAGMSAAAPAGDDVAPALADVKGLNRKLAFLWIGCGKDDFLLSRNEEFVALLKEKGVTHEWQLTEGGHSWPVWRDYLAQLAQRLFKKA